MHFESAVNKMQSLVPKRRTFSIGIVILECNEAFGTKAEKCWDLGHFYENASFATLLL